jgi:YHS domain-containing protein
MMRMKRISIAVVVAMAVSSAAVAAFAFRHDPLNEKCPVSGKDIAEKASHVKVKFCGDECKEKFIKDPFASLGKMDKVPNEKCPPCGNPVKESTVTVAIGFCCGDCKDKFDANPAEYLGKVKGGEKKKK